MTETEPRAIIIAGPNGAGKTTFAREFLPMEAHCPVFVNADLIAAGLSPFAPEAAAIKAGRIMPTEIDDHVAHRRSFALETTLSGRAYAAKVRHWRALGYQVSLYFLQLPTAEMAIERVRGWPKAGTTFQTTWFGGGLLRGCSISKIPTSPSSTPGFCTANPHRQPTLLARGTQR